METCVIGLTLGFGAAATAAWTGIATARRRRLQKATRAWIQDRAKGAPTADTKASADHQFETWKGTVDRTREVAATTATLILTGALTLAQMPLAFITGSACATVVYNQETSTAEDQEKNAAMLLPDDRRPRDLLLQPTNFCAYSLGDWIETCRLAGVAHVPAVHVTDVERCDILNHDHAGPHQERLDTAYDAIERARRPGSMMRWDCCASANMKYAMAEGIELNDARRQSLPLDSRIQELAYEFPTVPRTGVAPPMARRPDARHRRYPVEYRAFIHNGKLTGISSYYPQRPLPRNDTHLDQIRADVAALLEHLKGPFDWPAEKGEVLGIRFALPRLEGREPDPSIPDPNGVHGTADFIATSDGILLLEGGPPHFMGAHPCCFPAGNTEGVALEEAECP